MSYQLRSLCSIPCSYICCFVVCMPSSGMQLYTQCLHKENTIKSSCHPLLSWCHRSSHRTYCKTCTVLFSSSPHTVTVHHGEQLVHPPRSSDIVATYHMKCNIIISVSKAYYVNASTSVVVCTVSAQYEGYMKANCTVWLENCDSHTTGCTWPLHHDSTCSYLQLSHQSFLDEQHDTCSVAEGHKSSTVISHSFPSLRSCVMA